jgi:plastocyanin
MRAVMKRLGWSAVAVVAVVAVACSGDDPASAIGRGPAAAAVVATGDVAEVRMIGVGRQAFEPADFTVRRGDVVRFVLESGVHNASFPPDRNPAGVKLPAPTSYLQAPGQTYDVIIDLPPGEYFYQCDPHVALGMYGTITVRD